MSKLLKTSKSHNLLEAAVAHAPLLRHSVAILKSIVIGVSQSVVAQADEELRGGAHAPPLAPGSSAASPLKRFAPLVGLVAVGVLFGMGLQRLTGSDAPLPTEMLAERPATTPGGIAA